MLAVLSTKMCNLLCTVGVLVYVCFEITLRYVTPAGTRLHPDN